MSGRLLGRSKQQPWLWADTADHIGSMNTFLRFRGANARRASPRTTPDQPTTCAQKTVQSIPWAKDCARETVQTRKLCMKQRRRCDIITGDVAMTWSTDAMCRIAPAGRSEVRYFSFYLPIKNFAKIKRGQFRSNPKREWLQTDMKRTEATTVGSYFRAHWGESLGGPWWSELMLGTGGPNW